MKTIRVCLGMSLGLLTCMTAVRGQATTTVVPLTKIEEQAHSLYLGLGYGPTSVKLGTKQRNIEGINFNLDADAQDLGFSGFIGLWINSYVAIELGHMEFGTIDVPFTFQDPHDNSSGPGQAEASFSGSTVSLRMGTDIGQKAQAFVRFGAVNWTNSIESRFDIPGQPAIRRTLSDTGTGMSLGAGLNFMLTDCWRLQVEGMHDVLGEDTIDMATLGLVFDMGKLLNFEAFDGR